MPVKFRKEMGKKIVVAPGLDNCLFVFAEKEWQKFADKLSAGSMFQTDNRSFNRIFFGEATDVEVDGAGRMLVPDYLKEKAGLKNKVAIIGVQNRIEIWNEKTWNEYKENTEKKVDVLAEKMGSVGVL